MENTKISMDKNISKDTMTKEKGHTPKKLHIDIFYIDAEILSSHTIRISYKDKYYIIRQHNTEISSSTIESAIIVISQMLTEDLCTLLEYKKARLLDWNCIAIYTPQFEYIWSDEMNDVPLEYQEGGIPKDKIQARDQLYMKSIQRKLIQWLRVIKDCRIE